MEPYRILSALKAATVYPATTTNSRPLRTVGIQRTRAAVVARCLQIRGRRRAGALDCVLLRSEPEHEQHRLIALLLEFRREHMLVQCNPAQPGQDRDILPAVDLEGHWRRVESHPDVDPPELLQCGVVIGDER